MQQLNKIMQAVIGKYLVIPPIKVNKTVVKGSYGIVEMKPVSSLFLNNPKSKVVSKTVKSKYPQTFEAVGQASGLVLYRTVVNQKFRYPAKLVVPGGIRDRGYVFVDGQGPMGILDRMSDISEMPLQIESGQTLQIVVENMGRVCFGPGINDFKAHTFTLQILELDIVVRQNSVVLLSLVDWKARQKLPLNFYVLHNLYKNVVINTRSRAPMYQK